MQFDRAPVVHKNGPHMYQAYVEGDRGATADERLTLEYAFSNYAHLVPRGIPMTGSQWAAAIARQYDVAEPRNREVVAVINKVMLTKKFRDDHLLYDRDSLPVFRGTLNECFAITHQLQSASVSNSGWSTRAVAEVDPADCQAAEVARVKRELMGFGQIVDMTDHPVHVHSITATPFRLPSHLSVAVHKREGDTRDSLLKRQMLLLASHPVRAESFSDVQNEDHQAQVTLMASLVAHQGYSALVAQITPGSFQKGEGMPPRDPRAPLNAQDIYDSLAGLVGDLLRTGWSPGEKNNVFLCRPAPLINPFAVVQPFESMVHESLIGWRLPLALVRHAVDTALELELAKAPRERA
jgi:hypothetical protein